MLRKLGKIDAERARRAEERSRADEAAQRHQDQVNIFIALLKLLKHFKTKEKQKQRAQDEKRPSERRHSARKYSTSGLVGLAAGFACLQWIAMSRQQGVMERQLLEIQEEQRAWVSISNPTITGIGSDANGIRITLGFPLKNTGKNPAIDAIVNLGADIDRHPNKAWDTQVCANTSDGFGFGIFPGDVLETEMTTYISPDKVAAQSQKFHGPQVFITPYIVACVAYKDAVTEKWHHSPYVLSLRMKSAKPPRGCCAIALDDLPIEGKDLVMVVWPSGSKPD